MISITSNYINKETFKEICIDILLDSSMKYDIAEGLYRYSPEVAVLTAIKQLYLSKEYDTDRAKVMFDYLRAINPSQFNHSDGNIKYYFA